MYIGTECQLHWMRRLVVDSPIVLSITTQLQYCSLIAKPATSVLQGHPSSLMWVWYRQRLIYTTGPPVPACSFRECSRRLKRRCLSPVNFSAALTLAYDMGVREMSIIRHTLILIDMAHRGTLKIHKRLRRLCCALHLLFLQKKSIKLPFLTSHYAPSKFVLRQSRRKISISHISTSVRCKMYQRNEDTKANGSVVLSDDISFFF